MANNGLTGPKLVEITPAYAADFAVDIPHARYPFDALNKRTALLDNLLCFAPKQQYQIIRELCDRLNPDGSIAPLVALKMKLLSEYRDFADQDNAEAIHRTLIIETRHWLPVILRSKSFSMRRSKSMITEFLSAIPLIICGWRSKY